MAINREALSEVLKPLIEGRDDSADILEAIVALDVDPEIDTQAAVDAALAEAKKEFNARFERAFFNPANDDTAAAGETVENIVEDGDNHIPEAPSIDDLFETKEA